MIKAINHIGIMTKDLQQSVEFYTDVLGFSVSANIEVKVLKTSILKKRYSFKYCVTFKLK